MTRAWIAPIGWTITDQIRHAAGLIEGGHLPVRYAAWWRSACRCPAIRMTFAKATVAERKNMAGWIGALDAACECRD